MQFKIINNTLDTYYAEDGITFEEWMNSPYYTENYVVSDNMIFSDSTLRYKLTSEGGGNFARLTSKVNEQGAEWYWYDTYYGGPS